jgi:hypothetical protein
VPSILELEPLIAEPREDLGVEHKGWLNLTLNDHKAVVAKAAIALANHGGGFIVIGLKEDGPELLSQVRPAAVPEITQDAINSAIRRFATPEFHCEMYGVKHPLTNVVHPVIVVPGTITVPVMCKRDCSDIIAQNRCYVRKAGPRSEEPRTAEEWRTLFNRCLRAGREDMLEAIRSIVSGRIEVPNTEPNALGLLGEFCNQAKNRWQELVEGEPQDSPSRFPNGYYEMGFGLVGASPTKSLAELHDSLATARRIKLTGWTPFLEMSTPGWSSYAHENVIESWVGRPIREEWMTREPGLCDFWRAAPDGRLYTIRGYSEDGLATRPAGQLFDVTLPVWRIAEGLLFANRLAATFENVDAIAIRCRFTGLAGRRLTSVVGNRAVFGDDVSGTNEITLSSEATPEQIQDNLAEVLHPLLLPLYERFSFFQLPFVLVEEELAAMRRGRG